MANDRVEAVRRVETSVAYSAVTDKPESSQKSSPSAWRGTLSGLCASFVGIGLARFGYTPLLPAIIGAHWFAASAAAYLGAANLAGYLAGALLANVAAARLPVRPILQSMMTVATVGFFACAHPVSFLWFFVWRLLSGVAGGTLMVLVAPTILPHIPPSRHGLASGTIFTGIGLGIAASGTIVPVLLRQGLTQTWLGLGIVALILTVISWNGWPTSERVQTASTRPGHQIRIGKRVNALYAEYALNAVGLVPHMIFLVDFVARGLHQGINTGSEYWVLFGLGAMVGPILNGHLADRIGYGPALRLAYLVQATAVALPALGLGSVWLMISSVIVGASAPGVVPLVLGRIHELLVHHPSAHRGAWSRATTSFATFQALSAYGMSFLFARDGNYMLLFEIGSAAMVMALAIDLFVSFGGTRKGGSIIRPQAAKGRVFYKSLRGGTAVRQQGNNHEQEH